MGIRNLQNIGNKAFFLVKLFFEVSQKSTVKPEVIKMLETWDFWPLVLLVRNRGIDYMYVCHLIPA